MEREDGNVGPLCATFSSTLPGGLRQMKNKLWLGFSIGNSYSFWNARIICKMGGLYGKHCDNVWAPLHGALQIIQ